VNHVNGVKEGFAVNSYISDFQISEESEENGSFLYRYT
jgi:hypothetical protein